MLYSLTGTLAHKEPGMAVVECGGVGFRCAVTLSTSGQLPGVGSTVTLLTHLYVREDILELFGFVTPQELQQFRLLLSVSGVGPKVALAILSDIPSERLTLCLAAGDAKALTQANGVGAKLAQRIILELKDKVTATGVGGAPLPAALESPTSQMGEAAAALTALGYSQSEAAAVLAGLEPGLDTQTLVRSALRLLAAGRG